MPCHHVVERLARKHRVFYIDNFGGIRDIHWHDLARLRMLKKRNDVPAVIHRQVEGVKVWRPKIIPIPRFPLLQKWNGRHLNQFLRTAIAETKVERPIIWTRLPTELVWRAIDGIDRSQLIYQMIDKFPEHPKIAPSLRPRHAKWEQTFAESADLIFASARGLYEEKKLQNPNSHFFPNGAAEIFRQTTRPPVASDRRKVIGFAGVIGTSLEIDWVVEAARSLPDFQFVLLGPVDPETDVSALAALKNVKMPGRVEHATLPEWFSSFDAAFMAYRENHYQRYTFPSKMAEYLLAGLPVVARRNPEIEAYASVLHVVDSSADMIQALKVAVEERFDDTKEASRKAVGESLSWDRIVEGMEKVLESGNFNKAEIEN